MMRDFEILKRRVDTTGRMPLKLKIPATLNETTRKYLDKSFAEAVADSEYADHMTVVTDKVRISADLARQLFQTVADKLIPTLEQCVEDVARLKVSKPVSLILLVGGFSESLFMQETIKKRYEQTMEVCSVCMSS